MLPESNSGNICCFMVWNNKHGVQPYGPMMKTCSSCAGGWLKLPRRTDQQLKISWDTPSRIPGAHLKTSAVFGSETNHPFYSHSWWLISRSLWIRTPPEKVLNPPKSWPKDFLRRHSWIHRDLYPKCFFVHPYPSSTCPRLPYRTWQLFTISMWKREGLFEDVLVATDFSENYI